MIIKEQTELGLLLKAKRISEHQDITEQGKSLGLTGGYLSRVSTGVLYMSPTAAKKVLDKYGKDGDFVKDFLPLWVKQYQKAFGLPMPKTSREATVAAYFLLGEDYVKDANIL